MRSVFLIAALILAACGGSNNVETATTTASLAALDVDDPASLRAHGARQFKKCGACHTLGESERHKVGPNLWAVFGDTAGTRDGFNSSKAMAASDIVWTDETMDAYLADPRGYIPGNRMSFIGLRNPEHRLAVIAYLREQTVADSTAD